MNDKEEEKREPDFRQFNRRPFRIAASAVGLLISLMIVEFAVRAYDKARSGVPLFQTYQSQVLPDSLLGYRLRPGRKGAGITINRLGMRGREVSLRKPQGVLRIIAMGGSTTFGVGVKDNETYPFYLEKKLREAGLSVQVLNAGVQGYHSYHHLLRLSELFKLEPDMILLYTGWNDFGVRLVLGDKWRPNTTRGSGVLFDPATRPFWQRVALRFSTYSALLNHAKSLVVKFRWRKSHSVAERKSIAYIEDTRVLENYRRNMEEIVTRIQNFGANAVLASQVFILRTSSSSSDSRALARTAPDLYRRDARYWAAYARWRDEMNQTVKDVAKGKNAVFLDCASDFEEYDVRDRAQLFQDMIHLTPTGYERLAESMARRLLQNESLFHQSGVRKPSVAPSS
ncbi:MAG: SGNH/GDSL hydrolase family protein [Candidatus Hydrogenedentota bacterium]|nr:MAG: SGNH/GDSL hydrolase family protein [Candidatus Hydrogenedentota bacterium]